MAASALDLASRVLSAHADLTLDPALARLLPVPLQARGPLALAVDLEGPLDALGGRVRLDHRGGRLVMRDPPVEVAGLELDATLERGGVTIESGQAGLNRGRLLLGGGWDRGSGQGVVLQLDDVTFVVAGGMVTRWSGTVAVEPDPDHLARVTGELVLDGGLWDRPVDLAATVLSPSAAPVAADDPTNDVVLDLEVRGRGNISVDNNLGTFEVGWGVLEVRGTVARPVLRGEVQIAPGGEIALTGKAVEVQRGVIEFTGEPGAEPRVELVPAGSALADAGEDFDAQTVAAKGLATGLGSVLGLENDTLQPAEIAVETETDPGTRISFGQRLSRQIALFFTADVADPQDRVTMLQLWNLRGLPGLALQAFSEASGQDGASVVEKLRWGGSEATVDRPVIQRLRLDGEWPLRKRRMRRASGLDKGIPFEPILLFVATVRMERELAAEGYYDARVEAVTEGNERQPTLVFTCEPGPRQPFRFEGDRLPRAARREAVGLYQPPPVEGTALEAIRATIARRLASKGYPEAAVDVARVGDEVVVAVAEGRKVKLEGPVVEGVPPEVAADLALALEGPAQLADLLRDPAGGAPWVERLVRGRGFLEPRLAEVWAVPDGGDKATVHLRVELGARAAVSAVRVEGEDPLAALRSGLGIVPGMPLDRSRVEAALGAVRQQYRDAGYVGTEARWRVEQGDQVVVSLSPGSRRTVDRLAITGLRHLSEPLLRRSFPLAEGDLLNKAVVDEGVSDLAAFAPVQRVRATARPTSGGRSEVELEVVEKPRWSVGLGLRWGSEDGAEVLFDLADANLLHRGASANLRGHLGGDREYLALITSLPPLPGRKLSLGLTLTYDAEDVNDNLREEEVRATVDATHAFTPTTKLRAYSRLARTHSFQPEPDPFFPLDETVDIFTLGGQGVLDRQDDPFDPRHGFALTADVSWSSEISGDQVQYLRTLLGGSLALEPRAGWTWAQALRVGGANPFGGVLPPTDDARFSAGGQSSLRGFPYDGVGPVDELGDPAGGGALLLLNQELRVPLWKALRLALFADVGNVWDSWGDADPADLVLGAGLGLRWSSPLGPVYGDVAWPLVDPAEQGDGAQYYLGIGRTF